MKRIMKDQITFLIYGFVFWLPLTLVIYIMVVLLGNIESIGRNILGLAVPERYLYFGFGIILFILVVYLTGVVLKLTKLGKLLSKIPLVGFFFAQGETMTLSKLSKMQPCLFQYSPTCLSYGWILSEEKVEVNHQKALFPIVNVYYPNVPTIITGQVYAARKETVVKLANSSAEVINLLLYAARTPEALKYIPWEDESEDVFQERCEYFGLKQDSIKK